MAKRPFVRLLYISAFLLFAVSFGMFIYPAITEESVLNVPPFPEFDDTSTHTVQEFQRADEEWKRWRVDYDEHKKKRESWYRVNRIQVLLFFLALGTIFLATYLQKPSASQQTQPPP